MDLEYDDRYAGELNFACFGQMLDSPTQCYKFYWLEAIMNLMVKKDCLTFDEIFDEMIILAWYSVTQYHLYLGPSIDGKRRDAIENAIESLIQNTGLNEYSSLEEIQTGLIENRELVKGYKSVLAKNVPYRLLTSFLPELRKMNGDGEKILYIQKMNRDIKLPYIIENDISIQKRVVIQQEWKPFLLDNYIVIKNWIQFNKIQFLQMINPGVPGIINKLNDERLKVRHLENVRDLWKGFISVSDRKIIDIYSGEELHSNFDVDHFIPWSYVSHDEMWNLLPVNPNTNRSKSNHLPKWNWYFHSMANLEYELYKSIYKNTQLHHLFDKCKARNLQSVWAIEELYVPGLSRDVFIHQLESHVQNLYHSAKIQGYKEWKYN